MTFNQVIADQKAKLQAQLDAIEAVLQKKIEDATAAAKAEGKNIKFRLKRLEQMQEIYKEYQDDFDDYRVETKP